MKQHHRRGLYAPELLEARIAPATFIVNSLLDNGDGPNTTLREAIGAANLLIGADTIVFKLADPLLPHSIVLNGTEILISDTLTIKGPGVDLLAVSGNDVSRIFKITDSTSALKPTTLSGLTLSDGKSAGDGGAIYSLEPLSLKNVVIRSSYATDGGGAAFVDTPGKISVVGSRIVHNVAGDNSGGLYLAGTAGISVVKTTIADNTSTGWTGLYARATGSKATIVIDTCIIANNTATVDSGGGIGLKGAVDGKIVIKNSLITGNTAADRGGGLFLDEGNLAISNTTFSHNTAQSGGGIAVQDAESLTISGSRFLGNRANYAGGGGGGAIYSDGPMVVKITSSLFSGNSSAEVGGAISSNESAPLNITGSSFLGNTAAESGGALYLRGTKLFLKSSTLSGNEGGNLGGAIYATSASVIDAAGNRFTENHAVNGGAIHLEGVAANAATAKLTGNLFQANSAQTTGGAIRAIEGSIFSSKGDRFIGNVAVTGQGGGVHLVNTGGILITGSLFQSNVAGSSGGGLGIGASATLTGLKVFDNISGPGGLGGGLRISGGPVMIFKSIITGNIANEEGGGILFNVGTTTIDAATKVTGNAARTNPNIGTI